MSCARRIESGSEVYRAGDQAVREIDHLLSEKVSGRVLPATAFYERAPAINEKVLGREHPDVARLRAYFTPFAPATPSAGTHEVRLSPSAKKTKLVREDLVHAGERYFVA